MSLSFHCLSLTLPQSQADLNPNALMAHLDAEYERLLQKAEKYGVPVAASWVIADDD